MIQRIQTIYLTLAAIMLGLTFSFPFATYTLDQTDLLFNAYGVSENAGEVSTFFPYYITIALSMGLALFSILQYKKRKVQITVGRLIYLLLAVTIAFVFIDFYSLKAQFEIDSSAVSYGVSMFLPVAALPVVFMANRNIRKDEALIKSLDRLR
jgi:hypothetical protein